MHDQYTNHYYSRYNDSALRSNSSARTRYKPLDPVEIPNRITDRIGGR